MDFANLKANRRKDSSRTAKSALDGNDPSKITDNVVFVDFWYSMMTRPSPPKFEPLLPKERNEHLKNTVVSISVEVAREAVRDHLRGRRHRAPLPSPRWSKILGAARHREAHQEEIDRPLWVPSHAQPERRPKSYKNHTSISPSGDQRLRRQVRQLSLRRPGRCRASPNVHRSGGGSFESAGLRKLLELSIRG